MAAKISQGGRSTLSITHSADISLKVHECVGDEEMVFGLLAALEHHHQGGRGPQGEVGDQLAVL